MREPPKRGFMGSHMSTEQRTIEALGVESQHRMAMLVLDGWSFQHSSDEAIGRGISQWVAIKDARVIEWKHDDPAATWHHRAGTLKVLIDKIWYEHEYHKEHAI